MLPYLHQGDTAPNDLTPYWEALRHAAFNRWRYGADDSWIRALIEHIINTGYSRRLYPYASIGALLTSIPKNGCINYERTFKAFYDNEQEQVVLVILSPISAPRLVMCAVSDTIRTFEQLLNEHSDWSSAMRF